LKKPKKNKKANNPVDINTIYEEVKKLTADIYPNLEENNKNFFNTIITDVILANNLNYKKEGNENTETEGLIKKSYRKNYKLYYPKDAVNDREQFDVELLKSPDNSYYTEADKMFSDEDNGDFVYHKEEMLNMRDEHKNILSPYEYEGLCYKTEASFVPVKLNYFNSRGKNILFRRAKIKILLNKT
jgi:hypothetical protein